ncbi:MAG: sulfotransferase domain-containing protein [Bacteroidetes bacterium]|nr:sulfotransferase domain-containing protein [Bacteroidota bacterium]
MLRKPNFFIVGAPKCGTTAMNDFLAEHPDIYMAPKEVLYFGADLHNTSPKLTGKEYLHLFSNSSGKKIVGESSVWYLYSESAAQEIKTFAPDAKILIMVRNPLEMVYAMHSQNLFDCNENENDFLKALELESKRASGSCIPKTNTLLESVYYSKIARYTTQIKRYQNIFGAPNVHIVVYDDFQKNIENCYAEVLNFLQIDTTFKPNFRTINANKEIKNPELQKILKTPGKLQKKIVKFLIPSASIRTLLRTALANKNTSIAKRKPISTEAKRKLASMYQNEISELSVFLNRDLNHWLKID